MLPLIVVTATLSGPDGGPASGSVRFQPSGQVTQPGLIGSPVVEEAEINPVTGFVAQVLQANGSPGVPAASLYEVTINVDGAPARSGYISVPASPPGSRLASNLLATQGSPTIVCADAAFTDADVGAYLWSPLLPPGCTLVGHLFGDVGTVSTGALSTGGPSPLLIGASVDLSTLIDPSAMA